MTTTYTFDIFMSLDGFGSHTGDWGGYWGKQGPELVAHRAELYEPDQRMVFGAETHRSNVAMLGSPEVLATLDPWVLRLRDLPATVVSNTLDEPGDWPDATIERGDAVEIVGRLKDESDVPLRSHGSIALNRTLMAAGLVDRVQVTVFPVITGQTGVAPIFGDAEDFDLDLLDSQVFDGRTVQLTYRPTRHG